ncbi:hypothetical protein SRCM101266_01576 [Bacillus amyloliquefaciens]|nr:hypothetical protein SRCM101266_01576 [Bacillus amyloliquefaciens]
MIRKAAKRQIEFRCALVRLIRGNAQVLQFQRFFIRIFCRHHNLEQRVSAHISRQVKLSDQILKRIFLMRQRIEIGLFHPFEQFGEGLLFARFIAKRKRIDKHARHLLNFGARSSGGHRADNNIALPRDFAQKDMERGVKHHVKSRSRCIH